MSAYPFAAVVGHVELKRALLANIVDPRIGGVLIRGDRGTAKTTAVRALAALLPAIRGRAGCPAACDPDDAHCPFCDRAGQPEDRPARIVELPLGATEDRVTGTLNLERVLQTGERRLEPGLLAAAHRGVLYIDEVNLLSDQLVDLLLDVAASGMNVVERDGNSVLHPARFVLVGTMNPEEGDLRPQLLDRFGLVVEVRTPVDAVQREEIVSRRIAFDRDPQAFAARFATEEQALRDRVAGARTLLPRVVMPDTLLALSIDLCVEAQVDGLRADIALYRAAAAFAALDGRDRVTEHDIFEAALLALPHRQRQLPDGTRHAPPIEDIVRGRRRSDAGDDRDGGSPVTPPGGPSDAPGGATDDGHHDQGRNGDHVPAGTGDGAGMAARRAPDHVARPAGTQQILLPPLQAHVVRGARHGRRRRPVRAQAGRPIGHQRWDGHAGDLAVYATVVAALLDGHRGRLCMDDVRMHRRRALPRRLVLLLVDASGSMGARERMADTKAMLLNVLDQTVKHRDVVALEVVRDDAAQVLVWPTRQPSVIRTAIAELPVGGRTPLVAGLRSAAQLLSRERARDRVDGTLLVIVTDGRYRDDLHALAPALRDRMAPALIVDTESGPVRLGRARALATMLGAAYLAMPGRPR